MRIISTWLYQQDEDEGGFYPQVAFPSHSASFLDFYRRCVALFFAAAQAAVPDAKLILFLNRPLDSWTSRVANSAVALLSEIGVEIRQISYTFEPPIEWQESWRNQFFVFDCLKDLVGCSSLEDQILLLDSDMIFNPEPGRQDRLFAGVREFGALPYVLDEDDQDATINGLSGEQLRDLGKLCGLRNIKQIRYVGGEFIACRGDVCKGIVAGAERLWPTLLALFEQKETPSFEEAHLYSLIMADLGFTSAMGNHFVRRIWTSPFGVNNAKAEDFGLAIWHFPAEKMTSLKREFRALSRTGLRAWQDGFTSDPRGLSSRCGIPPVAWTKTPLDFYQLGSSKAIDRLLRS